MPETLLIATTNPGKKREIDMAMAPLAITVCTLADVGAAWPEVVEDADTFQGNADKKALEYAELSGLRTLADDSGLEVDALDGAPGVYSARFAGPQCDDGANNARLLELLREVPPEARTARFRCAMAIARAGRIEARAEGVVEGRIVDTPRGLGGFGYDPYFFVPVLQCTTAELNPAEKNRVSHRGQALRKIVRMLQGAPGPIGQPT